MKLLLPIALLLFFISCEQQPECPTSGTGETTGTSESGNTQTTPNTLCPTPTDPVPPVPEPDPNDDVPPEALIFETRSTLNNFGPQDEVKVNKALEIIKAVVATKEFRNRVIGFTYLGKKQFLDNVGKTNLQIYQSLLTGAETLDAAIDHEMDLDLELYYSFRNTVGYTFADVLHIWMNTKYFYVYTPAQVAGNIFHEWTHKLGYDHDANYSVARDSSVPYALGYLMEELGKKYE